MIDRQTPLNIIDSKISKSDNSRRRTSPIEYIVIHVSASGGTAKNLIRWLSDTDKPVLVDYLVEQDKIYQLNDSDKYFPWSIGIGARSKEPINNGNIISVMLMSDPSGRVVLNSTVDYAQRLVHDLCIKYNIPNDRVLRFTDVSSRHSTGIFNNEDIWYDFKKWI